MLTMYSHITLREVSSSRVNIGQVVQITMKLCALSQGDGPHVFRELLKSICILTDGISGVRGPPRLRNGTLTTSRCWPAMLQSGPQVLEGNGSQRLSRWTGLQEVVVAQTVGG